MDCGECTECCELLDVNSLKATQGNIIEAIVIDSPAGSLCEHCDKNAGCKVHEDRPKICREYMCAYAQQNEAPIELRPDKCGIIFEKLDEDLFVGTIRPNSVVSEFGVNQVRAFNSQGFNVVMTKHTSKTPEIFACDNHDNFDILKKFLAFRRQANG